MNFEYLKNFPDMKKLYEYCCEAEQFVYSKPNISATSSRKAMEFIVKMIYASCIDSKSCFNVFEMCSDERFVSYVNNDDFINSIHYIRKMGNVAVHDGNLNSNEALDVLREIHFLVGEFAYNLGLIDDYSSFEKPRINSSKVVEKNKPDDVKVEEKSKKVEVEPEIVAKFAPRMRQVNFDVKYKRNEEENKKLFMNACLREAGWPIVSKKDQALPCSVGINMLLEDNDEVDYIMYGRDNKPLAIVEYSTTKNNLIEGRTKAIEKANKLANKYGYKPIIYYTNGYMIYIIDQLGYQPRRVFQFHSLEELELLKLRGSIRQDISNPTIDDNITNRKYQKEAIVATCKAFMNKKRHSLLVMATGTGKTRVSISLVDVLMKANWVKNVLFLADRTSLVKQAHKNFTKLLPSVTTSIYAGGSMQKDPNARIIFSTYQTMINLINDDTREFSIGRFDLLIIDEAHRSIFKKYGALFHYFDALMIGLTATPRSEDNKNTYELFGLENGHPNYAYELKQAIDEGYLVGYKTFDKTTDAMRKGIHYDDLSDEEKERFEDTFAYDDSSYYGVDFSGTVIDPQTLRSSKYINIGTIDAMLNDLMKNGLRIEAGDKLGKTIIFSSSHVEAEQIVLRFQHLYPHLGDNFCKLIDSQVLDSQSLIDSFGERDQLPQVAVSVDMLDTGIDVPDVLNLVFFKTVKSKIKFLQMIGRGTRLCPNIFGPGLDKKGFYIFDYYDNFNYFRTGDIGSLDFSGNSFSITPQSILLNERKLSILRTLIESNSLTTFDVNYRDELKGYFIDMTRSLCNDDIEVQYNMSYVSKYRTSEQWDSFTDNKIEEIKKHILPLYPNDPSPVKVKNFDMLIYVIEDEVPKRVQLNKDVRKIRHGFKNVDQKIDEMLEKLTKQKHIPQIIQKEELINKMRNADMLFDDFSLEKCEQVRKELRDLMTFIPDEKKYYIINKVDYVIGPDNGDESTIEKTYAEKVKDYIAKGSTTLAKISNLDDLTKEEKQELEDVFKKKLGSVADYANLSNNKPLLPYLRLQVGIADSAIQTKFGSFLNSDTLDEQQLTYMNQIISYARENGDITFTDLQTVTPFCDVDVTALFAENIIYIKSLINGLHRPVMEDK